MMLKGRMLRAVARCEPMQITRLHYPAFLCTQPGQNAPENEAGSTTDMTTMSGESLPTSNVGESKTGSIDVDRYDTPVAFMHRLREMLEKNETVQILAAEEAMPVAISSALLLERDGWLTTSSEASLDFKFDVDTSEQETENEGDSFFFKPKRKEKPRLENMRESMSMTVTRSTDFFSKSRELDQHPSSPFEELAQELGSRMNAPRQGTPEC
ncbi:hypothetical protein FVE85_0470 [Porphyridium purpureum]|uniref:Uncharacterized protein n=1 Tax=Porphyridium purpureum TaxID=35688 RepID=A0A5J4YYP9_PORPP|nr:hypothetical protein FVE85_0470 [Porphyridium purpureum]|eukprot:POR8737..scf208_2